MMESSILGCWVCENGGDEKMVCEDFEGEWWVEGFCDVWFWE